MSRTRPAALVVTGALSACLTLLVAGPGTIDAGAPPRRPPLARAEDLSFDADLVRSGKGATVRIVARSAAGRARKCTIRAALYSEVDNPMARVISVRRSELWNGQVALGVPAGGEAVRELRLPPAVAAKLPAEPAPEPVQAKAFRRTTTVHVGLSPECSEAADVG